MFEPSKNNPHNQDENFFAAYIWESIMETRIHSNHYLNYAAAHTSLRCRGMVQRDIEDIDGPIVKVGRPPERSNKVIVLDELGQYFYCKKIDEVV